MMGSGGTGVCSTGTPVTANQNVFVGQPITFTGCIPSSVGTSVSSEMWTPDTSFSAQTAVAGLSVSFNNATSQFTENLMQISNTSCVTGMYCDFNEFYFVTAGTYTFTFGYTPTNGSPPPPASITFVVTAPTPDDNGRFMEGPNQEAAPVAGPVLVYGAGQFSYPTGNTNTVPVLADGDNNDTNGISLTVTADAPNGSISGGWLFVQTIKQVSVSFETSPANSPFV
jgi:hypothetical protein